MQALLVSHGQPSHPQAGETEIAALAAAVAGHLPGWTLRGVTLASTDGPERLSAALPEALVYPMFMADGWFTGTQLPRRLNGARHRQLAPFGLDPALPGLARRWLAREIAARGWDASEVTLVVAGHGSGKSPRLAEVTRGFAATLGEALGLAETRCGFIEEDPRLADALAGCPETAICLPFFAARRGHVLEDLPAAVTASGFAGAVLDPIGLHPEVPGLIAQSLLGAAD